MFSKYILGKCSTLKYEVILCKQVSMKPRRDVAKFCCFSTCRATLTEGQSLMDKPQHLGSHKIFLIGLVAKVRHILFQKLHSQDSLQCFMRWIFQRDNRWASSSMASIRLTVKHGKVVTKGRNFISNKVGLIRKESYERNDYEAVAINLYLKLSE